MAAPVAASTEPPVPSASSSTLLNGPTAAILGPMRPVASEGGVHRKLQRHSAHRASRGGREGARGNAIGPSAERQTPRGTRRGSAPTHAVMVRYRPGHRQGPRERGRPPPWWLAAVGDRATELALDEANPRAEAGSPLNSGEPGATSWDGSEESRRLVSGAYPRCCAIAGRWRLRRATWQRRFSGARMRRPLPHRDWGLLSQGKSPNRFSSRNPSVRRTP